MKTRLLWALLSWLSLLSFGAQAQTTLAVENFEDGTTGTSPRYGYTASPTITGVDYQYFERRAFTTPNSTSSLYQDAEAPLSTGSSATISSLYGSYLWTAEGVRGFIANSTNRSAKVVQLRAVATTGYKNLRMVVAFASVRGAGYVGGGAKDVATTDRIRLQYSFNGGASWITAGLLLGNNGTGGNFQQDTSVPLDSIPDGTIMDQTLRDYTANISGTGTSLLVRVVADTRQPSFAFDNIRVLGDVDNTPKPTLNIPETTPASYTEGGSPVQLSGGLTVGYSDNLATNITGGTVNISAGFGGSTERLNFVNQLGITGSYNTGNGTLTLSGTTTQASYQTALRSITYSSTNSTTLPSGTRQITFQLSAGGVVSNSPVRIVNVTQALNNPAALTTTYTEPFDTDGEGLRYASDMFFSATGPVGFFRSTTNPPSSGGTALSSTTYGGTSGGFWYGEGTTSALNPKNPFSSLQLAPVNASGYNKVRFTLALGASGGWAPYQNTDNVGDWFELFYSTDGGTTLTKFGAFYGTNQLPRVGPLQDDDLNPVTPTTPSANLKQLSSTLQDVQFELPSAAFVSNLTIVLRQRASINAEIAFDNIRITGVVPPTVTTAAATSLTTTSAVLGGSVTADGGDAVTARGVVYSTTNQTPAIGGTSVRQDANGTGTGSFSETIAGLAPGTLYYVRAYAINSVGTSYGAVQPFTTLNNPPVVTTTGGTTTYIIGNGPVAIDNGLTVTDADNPTLASATVRITSGLQSGQDVLRFTNTNTTTFGNIGSAASANGTLPLSSSGAIATVAQWQAALRAVTFENMNGTAPTTVRTVSFVVNDGTTDSAPATKTITLAPPATVVSVTRLDPSPTATAQVFYQVVFSRDVTGLTVGNFTITSTGSVSGTNVSSVVPSVVGSRTSYRVGVSTGTGTGNGTLRLNVNNSAGVTPTVLGLPYTVGEIYTIIRSFAAQPLLSLRAAGSLSSNSDVTAFVDQVQVLQSGTAVTNALQNGSFETNNVLANNFLYAPQVVAAPWSFTTQAGVSRNGSDFGSTASQGDAVALLQSFGGNNGSISQNLTVPTGTYQVNFQATQRNYSPFDQVVNAFLVEGSNEVFLGAYQPNSTSAYNSFTSPAFSVTANPLTATVSTTAGSSTTTTPIPFSVTFSQSVGNTFTVADVTVTGGTLTSGSFSGSGSGPYTFTVTPSAPGTVTVSLTANVASDANNTGNLASDPVSVQYSLQQVAPTVTTAAAGSIMSTSAILGGNVTAGGNATVTDRGVVYSITNQTPTTSDTKDANTTPTGTGAFSETIAGLTPGTTYYVRAYATNAVGTSYGAVVSFTTLAPVGGTTVVTNVNCNSGSNGTINLTPRGGVGGYTYLWNDGRTTEDRTGLSAGTYSVTITDAAGATGTVGNITVNQPAALTANAAKTDVTTNGGSNGTATITVNGGTPNYTYSWSPNVSTTATASNLRAGTYNVTVTDANSCTTTASVTINQPSAPTIVVAPATLPNGTVGAAYSQTVTASGGTAPYRFTITAGALPAGLTLAPGGTLSGAPTSGGTFNFTVTATDAASFTGTRFYTLVIMAPTITVTPASLPGGTVATAYSQTITASGGTAPYSFAITAGALPTGLTLTSSGGLSGTPTASGTFNFTVTATDASAALGPYNGSRSYTLAIGNQAVTAAPVVLTPANGFVSTKFPTYSGTAVANSTVTVIVDGTSIGTATTDDSGNWRLTASSALADGSHTVRATAQASGQAVSASSNTITFVVDTISPSVTIFSSTAPSGNTSGSSPFAYTVTFSENVTGFSADDVTVSNGTVSNFAGSGTTYSFAVTPAANGVVTVDVPVNVAQDAAGNGNNAATQYAITYQQLVTGAPVVTTPANGALVNTTPTYSGTASAGATVTVFVDNLSLGTTTATGGSWTLVQPTSLTQGTHNVRATAQLSGQAVSASSSTNTFTVDTVSPTITLGSTATNPTATSPIPVTVTFSESVTGFGASSVTVTNGILSGFSGSGSLYTFSVTPSAAGTVMVNIAANVAQDAAGNGNVAAPQFSITYVVPATFTTWTGAMSTDWYTAGNWTAGVPTATLDAIIPASAPRYPLVEAGTASAKNLSINSGASFSQSGGIMAVRVNLTNNGTFSPTGGTVTLGTSTQANILGSSSIRFWDLTIQSNGVLLSTSAGASVQRVLALTGNLITNGNPFTLLSSSTGDALVNNNGGVVVGTATVQRYIDPSVNAGLGARHYSAPVSNTTVADLATSGYTPVLNPAFNTADKPAQVRPFPTVFGYDQSRLTLVNTLPTFDKGFFSPTSFSDPLQVGQGYVVNLASTELVDFVGTLNNGDVTTTMASNRDTYTNDGGWQLVGNPYPAPLDYGQVAAADRAGLDASLYVYSSTSQYQGQYRAYVRGVGSNSVVSSGQGFFVRVSSGQTTGSLTLRNAYRLTAPNATTFQRTTAETRPLVQLTLQGTGSASDDAYVYFENGATSGLDAQFDAVKLPNTTGLNLSTSISGQQLAIDGRAELGKAQQVVPLAVGVPTVGTYTFTTAQLLNLANVPVYLRDLQLGTITDLRLTPRYQFTVTNAAALITGRFELVFSPQQALATVPAALAHQVALYPNPAKKAAFVELPASLGRQAVTATLVDALGRQVRTVQLPAQGSVAHPLDLSDLATGVYALRLSTSAGVVVKKLVVE